MARRNPGISPILSARGYAARVLWPQYTPSGGVNSGSEVPFPPSNTLQTNMSNLVTHNNPFKPITEDGPGRIAVQSKRGKTLYMTPNQIMKMGARMLAPGEVERALQTKSNPFGRGRKGGKNRKNPFGYGDVTSADGMPYEDPDSYHTTSSSGSSTPHHQYVHTTMAHATPAQLPPHAMAHVTPAVGPLHKNPFGLYEEIEPGIVFEPEYMDSALDNPRTFRGGMSGSQRATADRKRAGRKASSSQRRLADMTRQAEYEAALEGSDGGYYNNPRTFAGAKSKAARSAAALRKSQDRAIAHSERLIGGRYGSRAEALGVREMESEFLRGYYGAKKSGRIPADANIAAYRQQMNLNPRESGVNDAKVRRAGLQTKLQLREQALAKLNSGMSHNAVRSEMGLTYPVYMMVLRSHWTK